MYYKKQKIGKKWYPRSFTADNANGQGVDTPEEVSPKQFRKVTVAFIPEYSRAQNNRIQQRIHRPLAGGVDGTGGDGEEVREGLYRNGGRI